MGDKADVAAMSAKMEQMEKEIGQLHDLLSAKGMNSRGTTDIYGRKFSVPVRSARAPAPLLQQPRARPGSGGAASPNSPRPRAPVRRSTRSTRRLRS